jgi:hypothetical protein
MPPAFAAAMMTTSGSYERMKRSVSGCRVEIENVPIARQNRTASERNHRTDHAMMAGDKDTHFVEVKQTAVGIATGSVNDLRHATALRVNGKVTPRLNLGGRSPAAQAAAMASIAPAIDPNGLQLCLERVLKDWGHLRRSRQGVLLGKYFMRPGGGLIAQMHPKWKHGPLRLRRPVNQVKRQRNRNAGGALARSIKRAGDA